MKPYPDLEITLSRSDAAADNSYEVEMVFSDAESDVPIHYKPASIEIDPLELRQLEDDPEYGRVLGGMFFEDAVKVAFERARSNVEGRELPLRVRLHIKPGADALHGIRWETLAEPRNMDQSLMTDHSILFSRFIASSDGLPIKDRPLDEQKALVLVANPAGLEERGLAPIDVKLGVSQALTALGSGIETEMLASEGLATKKNLFQHLEDEYDILYIVAHAWVTRTKREPFIMLEKEEDGGIDELPGQILVEKLKNLRKRPRLIVLAACETGGRGTVETDEDTTNEEALTALGPALARMGIPAVLAMQGKIDIDAAGEFLTAFFAALKKDGLIDSAMAKARDSVSDHPNDWWRPVLYMRSRSARMSWYSAGFLDDGGPFNWRVLVRPLNRPSARCTPIIGQGLSEAFLGRRKTMAQAWSREETDFPLASRDRDDLPQVAQYVDITLGRLILVEDLVSYQCQTIIGRHRSYLSQHPELGRKIDEIPSEAATLLPFLNELITAIWREDSRRNPNDPYRALAKLNIPIYITTSWNDLLIQALKDEKKVPRINYCQWKGMKQPFLFEPTDDQEITDPLIEEEKPTVENPLVYYLFGGLRVAESLVLTEDDYFDYLIGVTRDVDIIPEKVSKALLNQTMLILGLPFDSWESRILFRWLMTEESDRWRRLFRNVAAQVEPTEDGVADPLRARQFYQQYFEQGQISIFWGEPEDFVRQLNRKLKEAANE